MLISPSEPAPFKALGKVSMRCEQYGADFMFVSPLGLIGIQRKEIDDLIQSIQIGGRLQEQLAKMNQLSIKVLLIEGATSWTTDGNLQSRHQWTQSQHYGVMWSAQLQNCWIGQTGSMQDSVDYLRRLERWALRKSNHDGLVRRPKVSALYGTRDSKDWAVGLLSQIDGIGLDRAGKIFDKVGLPLVWDERIGWEEILEIDGIGVGTVEKIVKCLGMGR